jgi:hypothetical protein
LRLSMGNFLPDRMARFFKGLYQTFDYGKVFKKSR